MTTKELVVKTLKVLEDEMQIDGTPNIGIMNGDKESTIYILGDELFRSPIEFYHDKTKTMFGLLFYDTFDMRNWTMTLRKPSRGYLINDGQFLEPDLECNGAVPVEEQKVFDELREACKLFKQLDAIHNLWDSPAGMTLGGVLKTFKK